MGRFDGPPCPGEGLCALSAIRLCGAWGRSRGPPISGARGGVGERRVVMDACAQDSPPDDVWVDGESEWAT